jgi:protein arginine kinase activator
MVENKPEKRFPERPLECGECKKPIRIIYTEIVGDSITHTSMCTDCPELQRRLFGTDPKDLVMNLAPSGTGLVCGSCGTTLEEVRRGHSLGCSECYNVFGDILLMELQSAKRLSPRLATNKKTVHIGRAPGEILSINPSSRLNALNDALIDTLSREDYEQAAWLRDQIKALTEEEKNNPKQTEEGKDDK